MKTLAELILEVMQQEVEAADLFREQEATDYAAGRYIGKLLLSQRIEDIIAEYEKEQKND